MPQSNLRIRKSLRLNHKFSVIVSIAISGIVPYFSYAQSALGHLAVSGLRERCRESCIWV
jgi:hypothetical protein